MILELHNIYKTYIQGKMEVPVLKDISLSVDEGEYVAIMGPSGSGKTTLMNIIGLVDTWDSGEYLLDGVSIRKQSDRRLARLRNEKIGFKIREAQMQKIPYMLIVGDKEVENGVVAVRARKGGDLGTMTLDAFEQKINEEVASKTLD